MAEVWRARHVAMEESVAIKVVHAKLARDRRYVQRFWREIVAMARLEHSGIVEVLDAGVVPIEAAEAAGVDTLAGSPWLAMPLLQDGTLGSNPPHSWDELAPQLFALLDALAHAHSRGVLHRDLKPANVLRDVRGTGPPGVCVADFGLAYALGAAGMTTDLSGPQGTPVYMAPEQFRYDGYPVGPWSDLYAVGVMVWELVTGERPFAAKNPIAIMRAKDAGTFVPFRPLFAVPRSLDAWMRALMDPDPARRIRRAADASAALRALLTGQSPPGIDAVVAMGPRMPGMPVVDLEEAARIDDAAPPVPVRAAPDRTAEGSTLRGLGLFSLRRAPVLGRRAERAALWDELRGVAERRDARIVLLTGTQGVGRRRLAEWLAEHAHAAGAAEIARADGSEGGDVIGRAVASLLRVQTAAQDLRRGRLEAWCAAHRVADEGLDASEIHAILPGKGAPALTNPMTLVSDERMGVLERVLHVAARGRAVVLVVQRTSDAAIGAIESFVDQWDSGPLLVLVCADETLESASALGARSDARVVELGPLPSRDIAASVRAMIPLEPALEHRIVQMADGIPAVATVLLRQLVSRGHLVASPGGYGLVDGAELPVLEDAAALALARFEEVERRFVGEGREHARRAIELAAFLGTSVQDDEWREAANRAGVPIDPRLAEYLERAGLARVHEHGLRFAHTGFAVALRERARAEGRAEDIELTCAEAVTAAAPSGSFDVAGRVGRHMLHGGNPMAAIDLLQMAAVGAVWRGDTATAWDILADRERAMNAAGVSPGARERVDSALLRAWCAVLESRIGLAASAADEAATGARSAGFEDVLGGVAAVRGVIAMYRDRPVDAIPWFDEAVARYDAAGERDWRRRALAWSAWMNLTIGRVPDAWRIARMVLESSTDPHEAATVRARLVACRVALEVGQVDVARQWLDAVRRTLNDGIYSGPLRARASQVRGLLLLERGDAAGAWRAFVRARRHAASATSPEGRLARAELAILALTEGRRAEAARRLRVLAVERPMDSGLGPWIAVARAVATPDDPDHERRLTTVEGWLQDTRGGTKRLAALARRAAIVLPSGPIATAARSVERLASSAVDRHALIRFDPTI